MTPDGSAEPDKVQKTSSDGIAYYAFDTPGDLELEVVDKSKHENLSSVGGFPVYHAYVRCSQIRNKCLPLDANPREPSTTRQVRAMKDTLAESPEDFVKKNNGMTILCKSIQYQPSDENKLTASFSEEEEGVCNGGHTYFAILTEEDIADNATVHLEFVEVPDDIPSEERKEEIVGIARARNNNNSLEKRSEADFLGYYDIFKNLLDDEKVVSWHEGDADATKYSIDAPHFIRMLYVLNPTEFRHKVYSPGKSNHKSAVTSKSRFHNKWFEGASEAQKNDTRDPLKFVGVLGNDIFELRDMFSYTIENESFSSGFKRSALYQDYIQSRGLRDLKIGKYAGEIGSDLPTTLELMLLGLFRSSLYIYMKDDQIEYTGWVKDPEELWNRRKDEIMGQWGTYFSEAGKEPREFIRKSAPYEQDIYEYGFEPEVPEPEILYSVEDGKRYEASESGNYWLDTDSGDGLNSVDERETPDGANCYEIEE